MLSSRSTLLLVLQCSSIHGSDLSSRQEKLLEELSEKDSQIADLEMDRSSAGAANRANTIGRLNSEKHQLHNQLKELVRTGSRIDVGGESSS